MFDRYRGVLDDVYGEGTWFMVPWLQNPQIMDIRTRPRVISSVTGTGDLQMVNLSLRVLSRPDKTALPWIVKARCQKLCPADSILTASHTTLLVFPVAAAVGPLFCTGCKCLQRLCIAAVDCT